MKFLVWLLSFIQPTPSPLAVKVRESREYLGMDTQEAADVMGISKEHLERFENGL